MTNKNEEPLIKHHGDLPRLLTQKEKDELREDFKNSSVLMRHLLAKMEIRKV